LSVTFLLASVVAVASGAISVSKAYEAIDMRLLILIGGMTAFGFAMSKTGTDQWLADQLVRHLLPFGDVDFFYPTKLSSLFGKAHSASC